MHRIVVHCAFLLAFLMLASAGYPADSSTRAKSPNARDIERGRYLVMIAGCNDCHTENFLLRSTRIPESERLTGNSVGYRGPWGTTYPPNLRLYFQDINEEVWMNMVKEIQRRPPMPYFSINALTKADARAIYRYIHSLGPAGSRAPKFLPPEVEPPQPYVQFPASMNYDAGSLARPAR